MLCQWQWHWCGVYSVTYICLPSLLRTRKHHAKYLCQRIKWKHLFKLTQSFSYFCSLGQIFMP
jgi:hypothetical protein